MKIESVQNLVSSNSPVDLYRHAYEQNSEVCNYNMCIEFNSIGMQYYMNKNNKIILINAFRWSLYAFFISYIIIRLNR